jgi:hypothetical protein
MKILSFFKLLLVALAILVVAGCSGMTPLQMETEAEIAQQKYDEEREYFKRDSYKKFIGLVRANSHKGIDRGVLAVVRYWENGIKDFNDPKKVKAAQEAFYEAMRGPELADIISKVLNMDVDSPNFPEMIAYILKINVKQLTWVKKVKK